MPEFTRSEAKDWGKANIADFYEAPITPITKDFEIDEDGFRENIEAYLDMGVNGLVLGGFIAEGWNMGMDKWKRCHEIGAEMARGKTDLWTIVLDPIAEVVLEKLEFCEKLGYNGVELMNPMTQLRSDDEIYAFYKYVTDRSNMGIFLYRTPVSGTVLTSDCMKRLVDIDTVMGVKQGSLSRADSLTLRRTLRDDFIVSEPLEQFYLEDLRLGGQVLWAELSYILYGKKRHLLKSYADLARQGKWDEAFDKWAELRPAWIIFEEHFLSSIAHNATYASAVGIVKTWCDALGLKTGPMLPPVVGQTPEEAEKLVARLQAAGIV